MMEAVWSTVPRNYSRYFLHMTSVDFVLVLILIIPKPIFYKKEPAEGAEARPNQPHPVTQRSAPKLSICCVSPLCLLLVPNANDYSSTIL